MTETDQTDDLTNSKGPFRQAVWRGAKRRCPDCGEGKLFDSYLKPTSACKACGAGYDHIRTDDFAPWLTIIVLGHIMVPLMSAVLVPEMLADVVS